MKSQARLRLRQVGRHHRNSDDPRPWPNWVYRLRVQHNLSRAFEMNVWPRHYTDNTDRPEIYHTMDYVTGQWLWHGYATFQSIAFDPECPNPVIVKLR